MFQIHVLYRNRFYIGTHTPRFKNTSKELLVKFKTFQQIFNKSLACLLFVKLVVLVGLYIVLSLIASKLFVIGIAHLILNRSSVKHFSLMTIKMHFIVKSRNYVVKSFMNLLICKSCYCNIETVHIHTSKYIRRICKYNTCCSLVLIS